MTPAPQRNKAAFAWVILGVVLFSFLSIQWAFFQTEAVWSDETLYAWYAHTLNEDVSTIFSPMIWEYHPPLFSLLSSFLVTLYPPLTSVRLASVFFGVLCIILFFHLAQRITNEWVAGWSTLLLALNPAFVVVSHYGLLDTLFILGVLLTGWGVVEYSHNRKLTLVGLGVLISLLTKRGGFFSYLLALAGIFFVQFVHAKGDIPQWGRENLSLRSLVFLVGSGTLVLFSILFFVRERDLVSSIGFIEILYLNAHQLGIFIPLLGVPFFFLSLIFWRRKKEHVLFLLGWVILFLSTILYPLGSFRHFLPAYPAFALLTGNGLYFLFRNWKPLPRQVACFVLVLLMIAPGVQTIVNSFAFNGPSGFVEEGEWLRIHAGESIIYDCKERETRLFSGIELERWGGRIRGYPSTHEAFEEELANTPAPVFAIVMEWSNPFARCARDEELVLKGFVNVYDVNKNIFGQSKSVIRIYQKG